MSFLLGRTRFLMGNQLGALTAFDDALKMDPQLAIALYEKGRQAAAAGKTGVAAVFFRTASKRAVGTLKQEIDADLKTLDAKVRPQRSAR